MIKQSDLFSFDTKKRIVLPKFKQKIWKIFLKTIIILTNYTM